MNAVEIEGAITALAERAFDAAEFRFAFLQAAGNKEKTIKRLRRANRTGSTAAACFRPTTSISPSPAPVRSQRASLREGQPGDSQGQGEVRSDPLRRRYIASVRGAFSGDDRQSLRPGNTPADPRRGA
jgi:hypothetical protein